MAGRKKKAEAPAEHQALVLEHEAYAQEALQVVSGWQIETQQDMDEAGEMKADFFSRRKLLEEKLKEITGPILTAEKAARNLFKPAISMLKNNEDIVTAALRDYELRRMQERRAALAEIAESGGKASEATLAIAHGANHVDLAEQVGSRRVFVAKLVDERLVPDEYIIRVVDIAKIQRLVTDKMGQVEIPGIEITEDVQIKNKPRARA